MPAPAPTFGNAAGDDLDMPEVGPIAGLCKELSVTATCLLFWQSLPGLNQFLSFLKAQSMFSVLVILCCENVHII